MWTAAKQKLMVADLFIDCYDRPRWPSDFSFIEMLNSKSHGLSPPGGFSFLSFD